MNTNQRNGTELMAGDSHLTFLNHAAYFVETADCILLVDPWLEGTAFNDGWALLDSSSSSQQLLEHLERAAKTVYIWYSHEHSDHFSIKFLRRCASRGFCPTIVFHQTLDKRVVSFVRSLGFAAIECAAGAPVTLSDELSLTCWPHRALDSYCLIQTATISILNINDCLLNSEQRVAEVQRNVFAQSGCIDILLSQFGYANWIGNEADIEQRKHAAAEKISRLALQDRVLSPHAVIPFASFSYFCHVENSYLNDAQNTPGAVRSAAELANTQDRLFFMKPWDRIELSDSAGISAQLTQLSPAAEAHWADRIGQPKSYLEAAPQLDAETITDDFTGLNQRLTRQLIGLHKLFELLGKLQPIVVHVSDHQTSYRLSYLGGMQKLIQPAANPNVRCTAATLSFIVKQDYGHNTVRVSGRWRLFGDQEQVHRFFAPQEFLQHGYGLSHPLATLRALVRTALAVLRRRLLRVN